jgi:hypothetical protein
MRPDGKPASLVPEGVDGVFGYKRLLVEILICDTCGTQFMTHVTTGVGAMMCDEGKEPCVGCLEILMNQDQSDGASPS